MLEPPVILFLLLGNLLFLVQVLLFHSVQFYKKKYMSEDYFKLTNLNNFQSTLLIVVANCNSEQNVFVFASAQVICRVV